MRGRCAAVLLYVRFAVLCWAPARGLFQSGKVELGGNRRVRRRFAPMSKFAYDLDGGTWSVRIRADRLKSEKRARHENRFTIGCDMYVHDEWDAMMRMRHECERKEKYARSSVSMTLPQLYQWSAWYNGTAQPSEKVHMSYLVLTDCGVNLLSEVDEILYEVHMLQADGTEASVETKMALTAHIIGLIVMSVLLAAYINKGRHFKMRDGLYHPVVIWLGCVMIGHWVGHFLQPIHLFLYKTNGHGNFFCESAGDFCWYVSETAKGLLLICVASGYTITLPELQGNGMDYMPLIAQGIATIEGVVVIMGIDTDADDLHKFHGHERMAGLFFLVLRIGFLLWFLYGLSYPKEGAGIRALQFFKKLRSGGIIYFLSYPLWMAFVSFFPVHRRREAMDGGLIAIHTLSDVWLMYLFIIRGEFMKFTISAQDPADAVEQGGPKQK